MVRVCIAEVEPTFVFGMEGVEAEKVGAAPVPEIDTE